MSRHMWSKDDGGNDLQSWTIITCLHKPNNHFFSTKSNIFFIWGESNNLFFIIRIIGLNINQLWCLQATMVDKFGELHFRYLQYILGTPKFDFHP